MKVKRDFKTRLKLMLRHMGMLCKKPVPEKHRIRIAYTIYPEGRERPIDAERAVWVENKKSANKSCKFDVDKRRCECGVGSIDQFAHTGCPTKLKRKS